MNFKCVALLTIVALCVLTPPNVVGEDESVESDSDLTTMRTMVEEEMAKSKGTTNKASGEVTKKKANSIEESEEDDDEDGEEGATEEEEETCDTSINSFVRNFNATPLLPDDYEQVYEAVPHMDLVHLKYNITDMMSIVQRAIDYMIKVSGSKDLADTVKYVSSVMMDKVFEAKVSPECSADLANLGQALRNYEAWPARFLDSMGQVIPHGLMRGRISSFGHFDSCIGIKSPKMDNGRHIYGRYCQMQFRSIVPPVNTHNAETDRIFRANSYVSQAIEQVALRGNLDKYLDDAEMARVFKEILNWSDSGVCFYHYALCFPSSCSAVEIENLLNQIFYPLVKLPVRIDYCTAHPEVEEFKIDKLQWFAIVCLSAAAGIILLCTLYHLYLLYVRDPKEMREVALLSGQKDANCNESVPAKGQSLNLCLNLEEPQASVHPDRSLCQRFVLAFSVLENTTRLCALDKRYAPLHGLQLIFTFFIFAVQCFTIPALITPQLLRSIADTVPYEMINPNGRYWFVRTPGLWMDGFMLVLGIFIVHTQFARLSATNGRFGFFEYLWKRWSHLSAVMFGALLLIFLFPLVGDGPMWYINKNWLWPQCTNPSSLMSTFLYYSNWNPTFQNYTIENKFAICNPPTWFFSVSTQLYLLAPLVFLPMYRWPRVGVSVALVALLLSPLSTLSTRLLTGHPTFLEWTRFGTITQAFRSFHEYHSHTTQYVTSLLIGLLTGYLIERRPKLQLGGKLMELVFFAASIASLVLTFAWNNSFWNLNEENSEPNALAWIVGSKFMFTGAFAYISYMCCTGRGGYITKVLTIPFFQPFARLSYGIYVLSAITILNRITPMRDNIEMYYYQTLQNTIMDFVLTTVLAYIMYLLFEGPCTSLIELFEGDLFGAIRKLENTDSTEELKVSDNSGHTSDSEKSNQTDTNLKGVTSRAHKDFA